MVTNTRARRDINELATACDRLQADIDAIAKQINDLLATGAQPATCSEKYLPGRSALA